MSNISIYNKQKQTWQREAKQIPKQEKFLSEKKELEKHISLTTNTTKAKEITEDKDVK